MRQAAHELDALGVRLLEVACKGCDDLFLCVERHIHDKLHVDRARGIDHILVDRVMLEHTCGRIRARNRLVGVVFIDRYRVADAGQDALAAAREAGEEVRLDKAFGHQQVAVQRNLVDPQLCARGQLAYMLEVVVLKRLVDHDLLIVHDVVAEHTALLLLGRRTVQAGGDQDGDIRIRVARADLLEQDRQGQLARHGAGVVACDKHNLVLALGQFGQARRADRVCQRVAHQIRFALTRVIGIRAGVQLCLEVFLVHMQLQRRGVIGD